MFRYYDRMFKAILYLLGFALFAGLMAPPTLLAVPINAVQAKSAVETFLTTRFPAVNQATARTVTVAGSSWLAVAEVAPLLDDNIIVGYITTLEPSGYVLVRADDEVPPIKIYTENGTFYRLPPELLKVIKLELAEELQSLTALQQSNAPIDPKFQEQWSALLNPVDLQALSNLPTSAPGVVLLTTAWNQDAAYNYYCPTASGGPGGRAYAGCTAAALAQILRYHSSPTQVSQDHTYTDNSGSCTGSHSISDAGMGAYSWANMPTSITTSSPLSERQAIGQLMYHAAVALESNFEGVSPGTSAQPSRIPSVLSIYFDYTSGSYESKSSFISSQWYSKISTDIDASQPVFYAMWQADWSAGHAVVCDGYRNGDEIHLNLGWSGSGNLWYDIDTVSYGEYTWTRHGAVFEIIPLGATLPAPILTAEPSVTPGTANTIYWSAVSSMAARAIDTIQDASTAVTHTLQTRADASEQPVSETLMSNDGLLVDDGSEPAQATLPPESVFVPEVEGEKVISDSEPLAATTIFNETFEGAFPGTSWTLYGTPTWDDTSYDKHGGSWSGWCADSSLNPADGYTDNMNAWMVYGPFSLADATSASMSFWYKNLSESGYDYFGWYASVDGVNYSGYHISGNQNSWRSQVFDLTNVYTLGDLRGQPQVWIAFNFTSDGSNSGPAGYTGAYVDDVIITKDSGGLPDLQAPEAQFQSTSVTEGEAFWVRGRIYNGGTVSAGASYVKLYLSTDNDFDVSDDYYVGEQPVGSLSAGASQWVQWDFSMPNLGSGSYPVWALFVVDSRSQVTESDENNTYKTNSSFTGNDAIVEVEYYAECADNSGFSSPSNSGWTTQRQWTFTALTPGQTYWYRVKAKSGTTESVWSNIEHSQQESSNPGSFQYSAATYNVNENGGTATITVTRTGGSDGTVGVHYATSNGTATAGSDYTAKSGDLSWTDGDSASKTFTVSITNDSVYEGNETVNLTLSSPTGGATLGAQNTAVLTIIDDDPIPNTGSLQFSAATYSVNENGGSATITVTRTGGSDGAVGVHYATSNGSATAGSDYTAKSGDLSWTDGDSASKTFTVSITNDSVYEGNETVNLTLSSPTGGATLGAQNTAVLTIIDDDPIPNTGSLQFSAATYSVNENGGSATITVTRTGGSDGAVSVDFWTTDGTATAGSDYTSVSGTLNWSGGDSSSKTFNVSIIDNSVCENPEVVNLHLCCPTGGATLGSNDTAVLTINDNDCGDLYQIVRPANTPINCAAGSEFILPVEYDTSDSNNQLLGIGIRVHFDSSKLDWIGYDSWFTTGLIGRDLTPVPDTGDYDGNPATDYYLGIAWADIGSQWPNTALPQWLADMRFRTDDILPEGDTTQINFSCSSKDPDYECQLSPATIVISSCTLDIDGNGQCDALTDGILILRYLFGFRGATLIEGAVAPDCTRCTAPEIEEYLEGCISCPDINGCLDIDGNGQYDALTDGILILRYLFGFRGPILIDGAVAPDCTRCTAPEIEAYLEGLMP